MSRLPVLLLTLALVVAVGNDRSIAAPSDDPQKIKEQYEELIGVVEEVEEAMAEAEEECEEAEEAAETGRALNQEMVKIS